VVVVDKDKVVYQIQVEDKVEILVVAAAVVE
jgi:hypothetical protein